MRITHLAGIVYIVLRVAAPAYAVEVAVVVGGVGELFFRLPAGERCGERDGGKRNYGEFFGVNHHFSESGLPSEETRSAMNPRPDIVLSFGDSSEFSYFMKESSMGLLTG